MLAHEPQGETSACQYHATYALTHDRLWLDYAQRGDPTDSLLWQGRLHHQGILLFTHHSAQSSYSGPVERTFWLWLRDHAHTISAGEVPLMVTLWGQHIYHCAALLLDTVSGDVDVSDSACPALQHFTWSSFLDSKYARAYRVEMLTFPPDASAG